MFGVRTNTDFRLNFMGDRCGGPRHSSRDNDFSATITGGEVTLRGEGRTATKLSPMAARMVRLLAMACADAGAIEAR